MQGGGILLTSEEPEEGAARGRGRQETILPEAFGDQRWVAAQGILWFEGL